MTGARGVICQQLLEEDVSEGSVIFVAVIHRLAREHRADDLGQGVDDVGPGEGTGLVARLVFESCALLDEKDDVEVVLDSCDQLEGAPVGLKDVVSEDVNKVPARVKPWRECRGGERLKKTGEMKERMQRGLLLGWMSSFCGWHLISLALGDKLPQPLAELQLLSVLKVKEGGDAS